MRRFQFNLDPVFRYRLRLEEQAQFELAQKQRCLERAEAEADELRLELRRLEERRARLQSEAIEIRALTDAERYSEALARALTLQERRVRDAAAGVEASLGTVHRRRVDREALERLRDRRVAEHRVEELRVEQQSLDEAAVLGWRRH